MFSIVRILSFGIIALYLRPLYRTLCFLDHRSVLYPLPLCNYRRNERRLRLLRIKDDRPVKTFNFAVRLDLG